MEFKEVPEQQEIQPFRLKETIYFKIVSIFVSDNQLDMRIGLKNRSGNFGNKKCFHSFVADLTKIENGNKGQDIARCRRALL